MRGIWDIGCRCCRDSFVCFIAIFSCCLTEGYSNIANCCRYGLSEGTPDEQGIKQDAQSGLDWLRKRDDINKESVYLYGQSIGGAVAIDLAARNPNVFRGLILENTFTCMADVIPSVIPALKYLTWLCNQRWDSFNALKALVKEENNKTRVLFLTGLKDELIPPEHSYRLKSLLPEKTSKHVTFPSGTHNDTCVQEGYFEAIAEWLSKDNGEPLLLDDKKGEQKIAE